MGKKKGISPKSRKKISMFIVCIIISVLIWLFFYLSDEYMYNTSARVVFINQPGDRAVRIKDSVDVTLTLQSTGWRYLFSRLQPRTLQADLSTLGGGDAIPLNEYLDSFNRQIGLSSGIADISPDTVYFDLVTRLEKKVPVVLNADISYAKQYTNAGEVALSPDSVLISGSVDDVRGIDQIETIPITLKDLRTTVHTKVKLDRKGKKNIYLQTEAVGLNIPVREFTEYAVNVPVELQNNTENYDVTLVPSSVKITYHVPVNRFSDVQVHDFKAVADLNEWQEKNQPTLSVNLEYHPGFIKVMRVEPASLDFMVYK